jgi:hypothetical protein
LLTETAGPCAERRLRPQFCYKQQLVSAVLFAKSGA